MKKSKLFLILLVLFLISSRVFAGTTGKIAGKIVDATTGEALVGANVIITSIWMEGIEIDLPDKMGAATDIDGYFVILNIPPGVYTVKVSMIGYEAKIVNDVRVEIDRTTTLNLKLQETAIQGKEVIVVAKREIIKKDVGASQRSLNADEIKDMPVSDVGDVVGLQAGITSGLSIRGSGSDQTLFMVDGISLRDERTNQPITLVPMSAIQAVSVQTGGFNAEYNNVRSGVVNVVTREGSENRYTFNLTYRNSQPAKKHFGISPYDPNSFWLRPYLDDAVCWTGTDNGAWDYYTRRQYPEFKGWNSISATTVKDDDPNNDLTPYGAQRLFKWQRRKQGDIKRPDYTIDGGFGGPVPFIGKKLGNLRFFLSFRKEQNMYLYQLNTDGITKNALMLKLVSDLTSSTKLTLIGLYGELFATATYGGYTGYYESVYGVATSLNRIGHTSNWRLFTNDYFSRTSQYSNTISAKITHVFDPGTFMEVVLKRDYRNYNTGPGRVRDTTKRYEIFPGYFVDEAPFGFEDDPVFAIDGMGMGGSFSQKRDYSNFTTWTFKADYTTQYNKYNQIKTGFNFVMNRFDLSFGSVNKALPEGNYWTTMKRDPYRTSIYIQDKLEFEGMIATIGLVGDYMDPTGTWYEVEPYDEKFFSTDYNQLVEDTVSKKDAAPRFTLSPRFTISHPISVNSKIYFNYGHFRQQPTSERMYMVRRGVGEKVQYFGNPTLSLARTISYELGYDHALFDNYLVHISGYYKDISDEERWVRYISIDGKVNYYRLTNNNYEDIRGLEIDIAKIKGDWFIGDINYEYRVNTNGYFGTAYYYQNPAEQRDYLRRNVYQEKPKPIPRVKANFDLHTPAKFGPKFFDNHILGAWHANFIFYYTGGSWFTWNPNDKPGIQYNVKWRDSFSSDLKISKVFRYKSASIKFFVDFYNLFNNKNFSGISFYDIHDYYDYMKSLHLSEKTIKELGYNAITGDDKPGDYRKTGVPFQPMEWTNSVYEIPNPNTSVIYYDNSTKTYMQYDGENWNQVSKSKIDKILKDKAYIDMPNLSYFTFLNPRDIFFGISISFDLKK